jgi:hypothetical protein
MANALFEAENDVYKLMKELVGNFHPDLALVVDEIAIVFKEKAGKAAGKPILGKAKKASPLFSVLGTKEYKFVLELAADEWQSLDSRQRKALMDHLLCGCRTEEDPESGGVTCSLAPPDISFYHDEIERWGNWRPKPDNDETDTSASDKLLDELAEIDS